MTREPSLAVVAADRLPRRLEVGFAARLEPPRLKPQVAVAPPHKPVGDDETKHAAPSDACCTFGVAGGEGGEEQEREEERGVELRGTAQAEQRRGLERVSFAPLDPAP